MANVISTHEPYSGSDPQMLLRICEAIKKTSLFHEFERVPGSTLRKAGE